MDILSHFQEVTDDRFVVLLLKDDEWTTLLEKLPEKYKDCFISEHELAERMKMFGTSKEQEFSEKIPTVGSIKSGDFGEILAYHIFEQIYSGANLIGPKKWRWKEGKDKAAPYSDVVFFSPISGVASEDDLLISVESKMKATNSDNSPIQNAIEGASNDYVSRLAKSLPWLKDKYKQSALADPTNASKYRDLVKSLNRYIESEVYGKYTKYVKAIAFIDKDFLKGETDKPITLPTPVIEGLEVYVVGINSLKDLYENTYSKITTLC